MDDEDDLTPPGKPAPTAGGLGSRPTSPSVAKVLGVVLWVVLSVYALLLVLTNRHAVDVSLVFTTVTMPLVVLLVGVLVGGALLGLGLLALWRRARREP